MKNQEQSAEYNKNTKPAHPNGILSYFRKSLFAKRIKLVQLADVIINDMSIVRNDIILVHTSLRTINLEDSHPEDLIYLLKMIVGTQGTLLMPAINDELNKIRKSGLTKSNSGSFSKSSSINELFRQMPDTLECCFQEGSFAAWGKMAKEITESNNEGDKSRLNNNLFQKLSLLDARIVGIGVRSTDLIYDKLKKDEVREFKRRGIPFFWANAQEIYTE